MTTTNITVHTNRTLYDKWNGRYEDIKVRIKELKEKTKTRISIDDRMAIDAEIQELYIQANLIHQFLADVGVMTYVNERKERGGVS